MKKLLFLVFNLFAFVCAAQDYADLVGKYDMEIKIGEKTFHDVLHIEEVIEKKPFLNGIFKGTLTVPGVFTAKLENTSYSMSLWAGTFGMYFEILAQENGQSFRVKYSAGKTIGDEILTGFATLEDGSRLGDFIAKKIKEE